MPEKKKQHLVPACYLKNFIAPLSKEQKSIGNFKAGLYVNDKTLSSGWKLRSVRHTTFTESYFYNLPEDDPRNPAIENYLSIIEGEYSKVFKEVIKGNLTNETMSFLSYFVSLQYMRVEPFIKQFQENEDRVAGWMDAFEGKDNYKVASQNIAKRSLLTVDFGDLIDQHAAIIYNSTGFTFVTSDNPVVKLQINLSDALKIIPKRYLIDSQSESREVIFFFLPLNHKTAYVSCEMLDAKKSIVFNNADLENIFYLNYFSVLNSYRNVYSSVIKPIKGEALLSKLLSAEPKSLVKIYTLSKRIISNGVILSDIRTPVSAKYKTTSKVTLKIDDLSQLKLLTTDESIKLIEVLDNGISIRGMRNCRISRIDYNIGLIVIESI